VCDTVVVKVQVSKTIEQIYVVRRVWSGMQGGVTHDGVATARSKSRNPSLIFSTSSSVPTAVAPAYTSARARILYVEYVQLLFDFDQEFQRWIWNWEKDGDYAPQPRTAGTQLSPMSKRNVARSSDWQPQSRNIQWQKDKDAHFLA